MCEPYKHWVIQDDFVDDERPPWEDIGAVVVPDVIPHELLKVRLLNVTHSAMCYAGILAGLDHVHETVTHEKLRAFLMRVMLDEIGPTLKANPAMSDSPILINGMREYAEMVLSRFENVAVQDQLRRIAMDGSEVPSAGPRSRAGGPRARLAHARVRALRRHLGSVPR